MKPFLVTVTALAALAASTGTSAQPPASQAPATPQVSAKAKPAIAALQKAVNANDKASIPALLAAAQAAAQTREDRWFIGELQLKAAIAAGDVAGQTNAVDAIVATGIPTPDRASQLYKGLASGLYNNKQYAQAAVLFEKATKANPADDEALTLTTTGFAFLFSAILAVDTTRPISSPPGPDSCPPSARPHGLHS